MKKLFLLFVFAIATQVKAATLELQVLEEASVVTGFDFQDHSYKAGLVSPFLIYGDVSLDVGAFKNIEVSGDQDIPAVGLNVHLGDILSKKFPNFPLSLSSGLLSKITLGSFVGVKKLQVSNLQIVDSEIHYGLYSGLEFKF